MVIKDNVFTACGGFFGQEWATGMHINCSGLNNGTNLPTYAYHGHPTDGFCTGVNGMGEQLPSTCDMKSMDIKGNRAPDDCTIFDLDPGAFSTCCSACGPSCSGCNPHADTNEDHSVDDTLGPQPAATVYIVRHGEKLSRLGCLNEAGHARATNFVNVFNGQPSPSRGGVFLAPSFIFGTMS